MSKTTRATLALTRLGVKFALHAYDYDSSADRIGLQAAQALRIEPQRVLKTLMAEVDGKPVCVVVPSDREVSLKKLAAAFRGKAANMMRPADAERLTGYHVGGISSFAQKKRVPVAIDQAALAQTSIYLNGGQRGLQVEIDPEGRQGARCDRGGDRGLSDKRGAARRRCPVARCSRIGRRREPPQGLAGSHAASAVRAVDFNRAGFPPGGFLGE
jgi:Cys-tRNA(Pro)/Cys-tRNA(Cys) deacylase